MDAWRRRCSPSRATSPTKASTRCSRTPRIAPAWRDHARVLVPRPARRLPPQPGAQGAAARARAALLPAGCCSLRPAPAARRSGRARARRSRRDVPRGSRARHAHRRVDDLPARRPPGRAPGLRHRQRVRRPIPGRPLPGEPRRARVRARARRRCLPLRRHVDLRRVRALSPARARAPARAVPHRARRDRSLSARPLLLRALPRARGGRGRRRRPRPGGGARRARAGVREPRRGRARRA